MAIRFLCPNGHKIECPDDQAGRAAKCPKCHVKFRIPSPSETSFPPGASSESDISLPDLTEAEPGGTKPKAAETIEFLCPNGHRLNAPAHMAGKAGQCPDCQAKFRIPAPQKTESDEDSEIRLDGVSSVETGDTIATAAADSGVEIATAPSEEVEANGHSLAELLAELWDQQAESVRVELHLRDGETLAPEKFAKSLSRGSYGVFGEKGKDGQSQLVVVAWDTVSRIVIRGLPQMSEALE